MIIAFFGKNYFFTRRKLKEAIKNYSKKHSSGLNLIKFSKEDLSIQKLKDFFDTVSMFDEKRCAIVENISEDKALFQETIEYIKTSKLKDNDDNILIISEETAPDKKDFKWLCEKPTLLYESKELSRPELLRWIQKEFESLDSMIENDAAAFLADSCSNEIFRISQEIEKLSLYKKNITKKDVIELVSHNIQSDIFKAIEALAKKDKKTAIDIFYKEIQNGKNISYLISMIAFQFRNMIKTKDLLEKGESQAQIAKKAKMHPFVVKKSVEASKSYSTSDLKHIYLKLLEADRKTKFSRLDPEMWLDDLVFSM